MSYVMTTKDALEPLTKATDITQIRRLGAEVKEMAEKTQGKFKDYCKNDLGQFSKLKSGS